MSDAKPKKERKKSKKKLLAIPILILLVAGVGYKMFLAPKPKPPKLKIEGAVVPLEKEFVVNLDEGHYGKVSVALVVEHAGGGAGHGGAAEEIVLPQEPVIRAIITDHLTGLATEDLTDRSRRGTVIHDILESIEKGTDEHVTEVLFTDLAVQ
jgi:flagellar basal body-associated protein FliL